MSQIDDVIRVMAANGGYATLGFLYQHVLKAATANWGTKTPFASMRRIVQDERHFFRIRPGLWALNSHRESLPKQIVLLIQVAGVVDHSGHSYYQGLLVEIGNLKRYLTAVPPQDKNRLYLSSKLSEITTAEDFYAFSYDKFVKRASTIDVVWFNQRRMPTSFFEVEHSTDIQNSLVKFADLQDFHTEFSIVADEARRREFDAKLGYSVFEGIKGRVSFVSYNSLAEWHTKLNELAAVEMRLSK